MKYYKNTCQFIQNKIDAYKINGFFIKPSTNMQEDKKGYLLWMMKEMESFDDPFKAARWIGWILAKAEDLGFMTNEQSRALIRKDKEEGYEK